MTIFVLFGERFISNNGDSGKNYGKIEAKDFATAADLLGAKVVESKNGQATIEFVFEKVEKNDKWQSLGTETMGNKHGGLLAKEAIKFQMKRSWLTIYFRQKNKEPVQYEPSFGSTEEQFKLLILPEL